MDHASIISCQLFVSTLPQTDLSLLVLLQAALALLLAVSVPPKHAASTGCYIQWRAKRLHMTHVVNSHFHNSTMAHIQIEH